MEFNSTHLTHISALIRRSTDGGATTIDLARYAAENKVSEDVANSLLVWKAQSDSGAVNTEVCHACGAIDIAATPAEPQLGFDTCDYCYEQVCEFCHQHPDPEGRDPCLCIECALKFLAGLGRANDSEETGGNFATPYLTSQ